MDCKANKKGGTTTKRKTDSRRLIISDRQRTFSKEKFDVKPKRKFRKKARTQSQAGSQRNCKGSCAERSEDRQGSGKRIFQRLQSVPLDRKSTRLNSSHTVISYAVFCLKKKKNR